MSDAERRALIEAIETRRHSRVVTLAMGDRRSHETRIARDMVPLLLDHLRAIDHTEKIDLFVYTLGGDSLTAWTIVSSIRQHCDTFSVIVPFKCLSAGTLIALGADEIVMGRDGQLSPVDPSVGSPFNPIVQTPQGPQNVPVSVEDLQGFIQLVTDKSAGFGVSADDALARVIVALAEKVHPLAIGAVWRAREQSRQLTERLLEMHLPDEARRASIAQYLLTGPSHQYAISTKEARHHLGADLIPEMDAEIENLAWDLYLQYQRMLNLTSPFEPQTELGGTPEVVGVYPRAAMESVVDNEIRSYVYRSRLRLRSVQIPQPNGGNASGVQQETLADGWARWPEGTTV